MLTKKQLKDYFKQLPHSFALVLFSSQSIRRKDKYLFLPIVHKKDFKKLGISPVKNWTIRQEFEDVYQVIDGYLADSFFK